MSKISERLREVRFMVTEDLGKVKRHAGHYKSYYIGGWPVARRATFEIEGCVYRRIVEWKK